MQPFPISLSVSLQLWHCLQYAYIRLWGRVAISLVVQFLYLMHANDPENSLKQGSKFSGLWAAFKLSNLKGCWDRAILMHILLILEPLRCPSSALELLEASSLPQHLCLQPGTS